MFSILLLTATMVAAAPHQDVPKEDREAIAKFVAALKAGDKAGVAALVDYPVRRAQPLPRITTPEEFVGHFDEYFDIKTISELLRDVTPETVGWRGTMIEGGAIWFSDGKITAINLWTDAGARALREAIQKDAQKLHASARGYDSIAFVCTTPRFTIRVEKFGEEYRYFAWKHGEPLSKPPELVIHGGDENTEGTLRDTNYTFKIGAFTYAVGDDGLDVERDGKPIVQEDCR